MAIDSFKTQQNSMLDKYGELACESAEKLEEAPISDNSKSVYKGKVRKIVSHLQSEVPDPQEVMDTIMELYDAPSTKNVAVMAMKKYYKVLDEFEKSDRLSDLSELEDYETEMYDTSKEIEEWIEEDEVFDILENLCPDEGQKSEDINLYGKVFRSNQQYKALIATLYYTGLRVSEALLIEVEHFDFENKDLTVFRKKKGGNNLKKDKIRITDEYIDIIQDYMDIYGIEQGNILDFSTRKAEMMVDDIEEMYKHVYGDFKNCDNLTPHKFRHGRVTAIANASSLEEAGAFVDHESLDTTMQYRHTTTEDQEGILPEDRRTESTGVDELLDELGVDSVDELKEAMGNE